MHSWVLAIHCQALGTEWHRGQWSVAAGTVHPFQAPLESRQQWASPGIRLHRHRCHAASDFALVMCAGLQKNWRQLMYSFRNVYTMNFGILKSHFYKEWICGKNEIVHLIILEKCATTIFLKVIYLHICFFSMQRMGKSVSQI